MCRPSRLRGQAHGSPRLVDKSPCIRRNSPAFLALHALHRADEIRDPQKLRASVERAGSPKATGAKATASGKAAEKRPGAQKRIRSAPKEDLSSLSKADLYKKAAADIPGRSHMTREDLVKALSSSRT